MKALFSATALMLVLFLASAAQATPWTPADLGGNLAVWLDAQDNSTLTVDGSNFVEQWRDKSGNGNHVAPINVAPGFFFNQPTLLATGGVNGKQSLAFSSQMSALFSDNPLMSPGSPALTGTPTGNNSYTMIVVYEYDASLGGIENPNDGYVATFGNNSANRMAGVDIKAPNLRFVHWGNDHNIVPAPSFQDGNPHFYIDRYEATSPTTGQNSLFFDGNGATYGTANISNLNLGADRLAINAFGHESQYGTNAHIGEVILISDALDVADRQLIEGYLAHKWFGAGALNALAADHPYKNTAPVIPEPSSFALCALGLLGVLGLRRRKV